VRHLAHDADLVAILEVLADAREVGDHRDAELRELGRGPDPRELEELGRVEGAAREDDLALDQRLLRRAGRAARLRLAL